MLMVNITALQKITNNAQVIPGYQELIFVSITGLVFMES